MQKRILIVDDRQLNLSGLSLVLKRLCNFNGEIRTVTNGRDAIREITLYFFNICFLDIKLPDIDGIEVMKKINEISPETDIVIMSACYICDDTKRKIEENASRFISKPFIISEIKAFIKQAIYGEKEPDNKRSVGGTLTKEKRNVQRRPLTKAVDCSVEKPDIREFKGDIVDISSAGMGMQSYYPLKHGHVLSFNNGTARKKGIVKWISALDDNSYRAGISFI